ncbi:hypothetical protein BJF78_17740 [Pseudonocardia sp. CNS-139]|nr:hypothetical protein BJF78_17740 [Pseudonocardia sp. CNS-139]
MLAFGLVALAEVVGCLALGGALLLAPVRLTTALNHAFGVPALRPGAAARLAVARGLGAGLVLLAAWRVWTDVAAL